MEHIDLYCERTSVDLLSEPLNAITNLAFLLAAWLCWRRYARVEGSWDRSGTFLMGMVALIGLGSSLFHTFATGWSMMADVIPIMIFIHAFLYFALIRFFGLSGFRSASLTAAYLLASYAIGELVGQTALNGSAGYVPPMAVLFLMGLTMRNRGHVYGVDLMRAAGVFAVALTFRTMDMAICESLPIGTHFLWHTFNGVALYIVGRAYMLSARIEAYPSVAISSSVSQT